MKNKLLFIIAIFTGICLISGCGSQRSWYKPDHGQVDFNLDNQECLRIAGDMARAATLTGKKTDPEIFNRVYNNCLFSRGWTHNAPGSETTKLQAVKLARVKGNVLSVFGRQFKLPPDFLLIRNQISGFEDVRMQTLFFRGKDATFLNIIAQQAISRKFDQIDYPVKAPFFIFDKGKYGEKKHAVTWTVFAGSIKGYWVAGIGAYHFSGLHKRISLVLTKAIHMPRTLPPEGLRLTKIQEQDVEQCASKWLEILKKTF